jgi:hypothetical protein
MESDSMMDRSRSGIPVRHRWLLNCVLGFHLVAVGAWLSPENWVLRDRIAHAVRPYLFFSGIWQSWEMFCPTPSHMNTYLDATIRLSDGGTRTWTFPRMQAYGLVERYRMERFRKWAENIRMDENAIAWADAARYVARRFVDPHNPPVSVSLRRHWAMIPPPDEGLGRPLPTHYESYTFFRYTVQPEDLR